MFHSYQIYHQTQVWRGQSIDLFDWGLSIQKGRMMLVTMTESPAQPNLTKMFVTAEKLGVKP